MIIRRNSARDVHRGCAAGNSITVGDAARWVRHLYRTLRASGCDVYWARVAVYDLLFTGSTGATFHPAPLEVSGMSEHVAGRPVSRSTYVNHSCRCDGCTEANRVYAAGAKRRRRRVPDGTPGGQARLRWHLQQLELPLRRLPSGALPGHGDVRRDSQAAGVMTRAPSLDDLAETVADVAACAAEVKAKLAQRHATAAAPGRGASVSAPADVPATPPTWLPARTAGDGDRFPPPVAGLSDASRPLASGRGSSTPEACPGVLPAHGDRCACSRCRLAHVDAIVARLCGDMP